MRQPFQPPPRRRPAIATTSTVLALLAALALLAGCGPVAENGPRAGAASGTATPSSSSPASATPAPPRLDVPDQAAFDRPVHVSVSDGTFSSVTVVAVGAADSGSTAGELAGSVGDGATTWTSASPPRPGTTYEVRARVEGHGGTARVMTGRFAVASVPDAKRLTLTIRPGNGEVVGVGAPIVVRFDQKVQDRAAVERALEVDASHRLVGAWHWVNDSEVRFRPKEYWPSGTTVRVRLALDGVQAGPDLWGGRDYDSTFTIGASHVSVVDGKAHTMTVTVNGKKTATWPVSLGRPEFATRTGTYVVLSKDAVRQMTSCNANITCDKSNPNYYDLPVKWGVRLTWSGTFVHAAPWSVKHQGEDNVSHGCVNLSLERGKAFFDLSRYGDVVTVVNTGRTAQDLVRSGDPGMVDWNVSWGTLVAQSALDHSVTTGTLAG